VLGLLQREPGGAFAPAPGTLRLLSGSGDESLAPILRWHQRHVAPLLNHLADAVRSGRPQLAAWSFLPNDPPRQARAEGAVPDAYMTLTRHPDEHRLLLEAMDRLAIGIGTDMIHSFSFEGVRRLIDLGGGSGRIARELLAATPHLAVEMVDLPEACRMAERKAADARLSERFRAICGDLTRPLPSAIEAGDAVLLSGVLADFAPEDRSRILANARALLRPGGVLLVGETLLDESRTGPTAAVLLSLVMLVAMSGDNFTLSELRALLESSGFSAVEHRPPLKAGKRDLVIARL
jgi:SAM-dependent methyltransferase